MICPHCSANLQRSQRTGHTCSRCRRRFALDPKENALQLHDLRMRRLISVLSDRRTGRIETTDRPGVGPLGYTADQLRHAAARKILTDDRRRNSGWLGGLTAVIVVGLVAFFLAASAGPGPAVLVLVVAGGIAGILVAGHVSSATERRYPGDPMTAEAFTWLLATWKEVYGSRPPGLLATRRVAAVRPPGSPRAALYCPDPSTVDFLAAAGLARDRGVLLVPEDGSWPPAALRTALRADPGLPVLALHDADPAGCLLTGRLRAALPPGTRVLDVGLNPGPATEPPVRRAPDPAEIEALGPGDHTWLADGNTFPLAALRPARLLRAVERAVERAGSDPEQLRAAELGFLAWPEPGP